MLKTIFATALFLISLARVSANGQLNNCVAIAGDSIAYGSLVVMIPEQGFAVIRTQPLSRVLEAYLGEQGRDIDVIDRSAPASALSSEASNSYFHSEAYAALQTDHCRYTIITPWINDLTYGKFPDNANAYIDALVQLSTGIPGTILVLSFYPMLPADFTSAYYGDGIQEENVTRFNTRLLQACAQSGELGGLPHLKCMETSALFKDVQNNRQVMKRYSRQKLENVLYEPIPAESQRLFDHFWSSNSEGVVHADGVHLSELGKVILIEGIYNEVMRPKPPRKIHNPF